MFDPKRGSSAKKEKIRNVPPAAELSVVENKDDEDIGRDAKRGTDGELLDRRGEMRISKAPAKPIKKNRQSDKWQKESWACKVDGRKS